MFREALRDTHARMHTARTRVLDTNRRYLYIHICIYMYTHIYIYVGNKSGSVCAMALSDGVLASYCAMFKFVRGWRSSVAHGGDEDLRGQPAASASSRKVGAGSAHCPPP